MPHREAASVVAMAGLAIRTIGPIPSLPLSPVGRCPPRLAVYTTSRTRYNIPQLGVHTLGQMLPMGLVETLSKLF
ncbi:hypothetical protein GOBAR_DD18421 [Gossypium barbadense]|nr:hypothetical protein GOBAR_DD18421 [Gossypium barbadense]